MVEKSGLVSRSRKVTEVEIVAVNFGFGLMLLWLDKKGSKVSWPWF